jgi:hypothetical protein
MDLKLLLKQVHMLHLKLFDMLLHMLHMLQLKRLDMLLDNLLCHQGWLHKMGGKKKPGPSYTRGRTWGYFNCGYVDHEGEGQSSNNCG